MPGPLSEPYGRVTDREKSGSGKTRFNRNKPKHANREVLGRGDHKRGSQNRNKNGRVR